MAESAVFTTWTDLHAAMLNALAEFVANRMQVAEYEIQSGGTVRRFKYRSFKELQDGIQFVKIMADQESGAAAGRTYARSAGRRGI